MGRTDNVRRMAFIVDGVRLESTEAPAPLPVTELIRRGRELAALRGALLAGGRAGSGHEEKSRRTAGVNRVLTPVAHGRALSEGQMRPWQSRLSNESRRRSIK